MAPALGTHRMALNAGAFKDYLESQQTRLPRLSNVEQISPRVIRILGQNAGKFALQGTNTYIVGTGTKRLLIDSGQGIPAWADLISDTLSRGGFSLSHVLLTHWHDDHTGGVPDLLRLYPHLAGAIFKHSPSKGQQPIVNGQIFTVEDATIRALHTPGHAHDHMCFVLEEEQAMLTGDNVLGHGTAVVEHLRTWMASLRVMQSQGCGKGYPAHGAVIPDLGAKIDWELSMKVRRERQALQALHSADNNGGGWGGRGGRGRHTVKELVTVVYGDKMGDGIRRLALEPCMDEVLRKLAEDGMVGFDMKGGHKRWFAIKSPSH